MREHQALPECGVQNVLILVDVDLDIDGLELYAMSRHRFCPPLPDSATAESMAFGLAAEPVGVRPAARAAVWIYLPGRMPAWPTDAGIRFGLALRGCDRIASGRAARFIMCGVLLTLFGGRVVQQHVRTVERQAFEVVERP
jgi:hypothetical protein